MTYKVERVQIEDFAGKPILLPRFQRKATWSRKRRFDLAIALYKSFPPGSYVVREDKGESVLLDGRQRRDTFRMMLDPHEVWVWASSTLPFKKASSADAVEKQFRKYVAEYISLEDWQQAEEAEREGIQEQDVDTEAAATAGEPLGDLGDLVYLLRYIRAVHPLSLNKEKLPQSSPLSDSFNFDPFLRGLPFVGIGGKKVDLREVGKWLTGRLPEIASSQGLGWPPSSSGDFLQVLKKDPSLSTRRGKAGALASHINLNWEKLSEGITVFSDLYKRFEQPMGKITIETDDPDDEKKIFEIINTGGSPLTAVEILSSRRNWNISAGKVSTSIRARAKALYDRMQIPFDEDDSIRRWDVAATLIDRIGPDNLVVGGVGAESSTRSFERRVTLGFQLCSGYYQDAISKKDLVALPTAKPDIDWASDDFANRLKELDKDLGHMQEFGVLKSWRSSLVEITSDAVALDFLLRSLDAKTRHNPSGYTSSKWKAFQGEVLVLLDRLIWEYVHREWRGSSDGRIRTDLTSGETPEQVSEDNWRDLINEVVDKDKVRGVDYSGTRSSGQWKSRLDRSVALPLLFYQEMIRRRLGENGRPDIDHIIPQTEWHSVSGDLAKDDAKLRLENSLTNLALLPESANKDKSGRTLANIVNSNDAVLIGKIEQYEDVPKNKMKALSDVAHATALKTHRGAILKWDLIEQRHRLVSSPHTYTYAARQPAASRGASRRGTKARKNR